MEKPTIVLMTPTEIAKQIDAMTEGEAKLMLRLLMLRQVEIPTPKRRNVIG